MESRDSVSHLASVPTTRPPVGSWSSHRHSWTVNPAHVRRHPARARTAAAPVPPRLRPPQLARLRTFATRLMGPSPRHCASGLQRATEGLAQRCLALATRARLEKRKPVGGWGGDWMGLVAGYWVGSLGGKAGWFGQVAGRVGCWVGWVLECHSIASPCVSIYILMN
jgi:hypothetical protein